MKTLPLLFWCLAAAISLIILRRRLPWQNVAAIAALTGGAGIGLALWCGEMSLPCGFDLFSSGTFGDSDSRWCFPFVWVATTLVCREVAGLLSHAWPPQANTGLRTLGFGSLLVAIFCVSTQPLAARSVPPIFMAGASPHGNTVSLVALPFLGWGIAALVTLVLTAPWLINKRPIRDTPDLRSLAVWLLLAFGVVSDLLRQHRWWTASVLLPVMMAVAACALRGARQWKSAVPKTSDPFP